MPDFGVDYGQWTQLLADMTTPPENIIDLLNAEYVLRGHGKRRDTFYFARQTHFPIDKKIVILSATVPIRFYEMMFGNRIRETFSVEPVERRGTIIQHTGKSYSRSSLRNTSKRQLKRKLNGNPAITFADSLDKVPSALDGIYFGNLSGYDWLKNKDINVVGTPYHNNALYRLAAEAMGRAPRGTPQMDYREISRNGFQFKMNVYANDDLQDIQCSLIESELMQAVGRARALRCEVEVNVFASYPSRLPMRSRGDRILFRTEAKRS